MKVKKSEILSVAIKVLICLAVVLLVLILLKGFQLYNNGGFTKIVSYFHKEETPINGIILFYGNRCSHCAKVDNFIKNNRIEDKVMFTRLEVFDNVANSNVLADKSQICGLNPRQIGVPFLWDGEHCIIGYVDVIKFFQEKISLKKP